MSTLQRKHVIGLVVGVALFSSLAIADGLPDAGVDAPAPTVSPPVSPPPTEPVETTEPPVVHGKHKHHDKDPSSDGEAALAATVTAGKVDKAKKKRKKLELTGRVFARSTIEKLEGAPDATGQTTLQSARAGLDYRTKYDLRAQLELEVATKAQVKDAYVQLRVAHEPKLDVRAGNFKMPFSAIQLESIWTLPMADRGLVDNILTKRLQVAGRAIGAMVSIEPGGALHPQVRAGLFQGRNDAGDLLNATAGDAFGQDAVLRASIRPASGLEVAASGSARSGSLIKVPIVIEHGYAGELDLVVDQTVGPGQLRAWAEAMVGTSWLVGGMMPGHTRTRFLETRAIAAYRFGGLKRQERYVEIYGLGAALDPDRIIDSDRIYEGAGGITYGAHDVWRIQLEGEVWRFSANAPLGIADLAVLSTDSKRILVQLGAHL